MATNNNGKEYLSREKLKELEAELQNLKTVERQQIARDLEYAKSLGDLSENAEYHEARDKQADIEDRIKQIEHIVKNAVVVSGHHAGVVEIGSQVTIKKAGGEAETYLLVGSEEANLAAKKISHQSPLGAALVGKQKGETLKVSTPRGEVSYTLVDVA